MTAICCIAAISSDGNNASHSTVFPDILHSRRACRSYVVTLSPSSIEWFRAEGCDGERLTGNGSQGDTSIAQAYNTIALTMFSHPSATYDFQSGNESPSSWLWWPSSAWTVWRRFAGYRSLVRRVTGPTFTSSVTIKWTLSHDRCKRWFSQAITASANPNSNPNHTLSLTPTLNPKPVTLRTCYASD